ncbi:MAG: FecR family protein [Elusimicrobiota bacterium]
MKSVKLLFFPFAAATFLAVAAVPSALAAAKITQAKGVVQVEGTTVDILPHPLYPGDKVQTGRRAAAEISFDDGSRIELAGDAEVLIEETTAQRQALRLRLGTLRAYVKKVLQRRFEVRTPTAVCSVRGTEFSVQVYAGGRTNISLFKGLLGIEDNRGRAILLRPNESLHIDGRGMGAVQRIPTGTETRKSGRRRDMRREVQLDMDKNAVLAAAARESKLAEYQQGKVLVDVHGQRVRLEEYILRPAPDQFKLVVLNSRRDRFDYFYYHGTFNKTLPDDLSAALRQLGGGLDTQPGYYLTGFETGRSNLTDSMREIAQGGHLVDVNGNASPGDDVAQFFDAGTDSYVSAAGRRVYQTLFDRYGFYLNGRLKYGWTGGNIQSYDDATAASTTDPVSGTALTAANAYLENSGSLAARSVSSTFPDGSRLHQRIYESYSDGSYTAWDNYIIDDQGRTVNISEFSGIRSGAGFRQKLLDFNYEQVITATEFGGRKIDLVVEPKILIQSGLIQ